MCAFLCFSVCLHVFVSVSVHTCVCICMCLCIHDSCDAVKHPPVQEVGVGLGFPTCPRGPTDSQFTPCQGAHSHFLLSQVEEVIHPQFLEQINSPDPQQDPLARAEALDQEEGLTAAQVSQGRVGPEGCGRGPQVSHRVQGSWRKDRP